MKLKIPTTTRERLRETYAEMVEATRRAERVTRRDGTDAGGMPSLQALNLSSYLGGYVLALLDDIETLETGVAAEAGWMPYRVEWQADLSTNWSLLVSCETPGEAEARAEENLAAMGGRVRVVMQRVVLVRGLGANLREPTG